MVFKMFQTTVAVVFLFSLISLDQLCGQFTAPQWFVKSTAAAGHCNDVTIFGLNTTAELDVMSDLEKWFKLGSIDEKIFLDEMASKFPTRQQCFRIKASNGSAFKHAFNGVPTDHLDQFVDMLALLGVLYCLGYMFYFANYVYSFVKNPSKYHLFGYLCAIFGVIIWCYFAWISAFLLHNWTAHWECTNFRPDNLRVQLFIQLVLSSALVCTSLFEIFFNRLLLQRTIIYLKSAVKRTAGDVKKGISMDKKREVFIVRLVPLPMSNDLKY